MTWTRPLGVRSHLAFAMIALALAGVGVAGELTYRAAAGEIGEFAERDLGLSVRHTAWLAADDYVEHGGWSAAEFRDLAEAERLQGHAVTILRADGLPVAGAPAEIPHEPAQAPILAAGRRVGTAFLGYLPGGYLEAGPGAENRSLTKELAGHLRWPLLEAALVAALLATLVAAVLAMRMARPLTRLTEVARRMEHGEIETRATGAGGGRETTELAHTIDRLAAALRRQEEVRRATVADTTHELRNSMVGIMGRVESLADGMITDEQAALAAVQTDSRRVARLIDDLSRLAEAQRPGLLVRKRPLDLAEFAHERVAAWSTRFRAASIELQGLAAPAVVQGDGLRLLQILDNLLANALRYTDPGGEVIVSVTRRRDEAVLEVADTGIGMAEDDLGRIFERFVRLTSARERVTDGSGVGLSVVRELTHAHQGRIEVESRLGAGSVFRVIFPLSTVELAAGTPTPAGRAAPEREPGTAPLVTRPA
jgi:two-component system, OmpR family, sensor histidine kinase BaeS